MSQATHPLEDAIKAMVKALVFYADPNNWVVDICRGTPIEGSQAAVQDRGHAARDALQAAAEQGILDEHGVLAQIGSATVASYTTVFMAKRTAKLAEDRNSRDIRRLASQFMQDAINGLPEDGLSRGVIERWERARDEYAARAE